MAGLVPRLSGSTARQKNFVMAGLDPATQRPRVCAA
jgi:hypothetical protein